MTMVRTAERDAASQRASVAELISDIDAELRLHTARIQEFLDGTEEFAAVSDMRARGQLLRTLQMITGTISDLDELISPADIESKYVFRPIQK